MSEVTVEYASGYTALVKPVPLHGGILQLAPGQSDHGYGSKISSDYMVQFPGEHWKYRVYIIHWSNNSSRYIIRRGKRLFLRDYELEEALEKASGK